MRLYFPGTATGFLALVLNFTFLGEFVARLIAIYVFDHQFPPIAESDLSLVVALSLAINFVGFASESSLNSARQCWRTKREAGVLFRVPRFMRPNGQA